MKAPYRLAVLMALPFSMHAQVAPPPPTPTGPMTIQMNSMGFSSINVNGFPESNCVMEIPPWVKPGGTRSYYTTTFFSRLFTSEVNLAADGVGTLTMPGYNSTVVSSPLSWWGSFRPMPEESVEHWRRNYEGIFSSHSYNYPGRGPVVVGFTHGENKNDKATNPGSSTPYYYQGTVNNVTLVPWLPFTYSGFEDNGVYHECFDAYNGFVSLAWNDDIAATSWGNTYYYNHGPVAWPSNGYLLADGRKASFGLRHPSSILTNGYIYIYYLDTRHTNSTAEEGRSQGIKVTRVAIGNALNEKLYETYYNGAWYPSLPAGYTRSNMLASVGKQGPKSTVVVGDGGSVRFSVAKIRNTNYYMGVEEYIDPADGNKAKTALYLSTDLVNWTAKTVITTAASWNTSVYHYPIFLDQTGWTNTEIDLNKFFILGTNGYNKINRIKLDLSLVPGPTPPSGSGGCFGCRTTDFDIAVNSGTMQVTLPEKSTIKKVSIYTMYGQLVKEEKVYGDSENFDIDINGIGAAGIYMISVETDNNRYTQKFFVD